MVADPAPEASDRRLAHDGPRRAADACGCCGESLPPPLLEVHLDLSSPEGVPLTAVGVGYELKTWRADALARHIVDWIPDFALRAEERAGLGSDSRMMEKLRRAYEATFGTNGDSSGAPAEVLLHAVCRELYGSSTLVNKIVFKTADNDTYKGFDAVHCVHADHDGLELWLGEAKFYKDLGDALAAARDDLKAHLGAGYLRNEFAIVSSKIDPGHPHAEQMLKLMHPNTTLEEVFDRIVIPVFVTYESAATAGHDAVDEGYLAALTAEAEAAAASFRTRVHTLREALHAAGDPTAALPVRIRLFILPMAEKKALVEALKGALPWQH